MEAINHDGSAFANLFGSDFGLNLDELMYSVNPDAFLTRELTLQQEIETDAKDNLLEAWDLACTLLNQAVTVLFNKSFSKKKVTFPEGKPRVLPITQRSERIACFNKQVPRLLQMLEERIDRGNEDFATKLTVFEMNSAKAAQLQSAMDSLAGTIAKLKEQFDNNSRIVLEKQEELQTLKDNASNLKKKQKSNRSAEKSESKADVAEQIKSIKSISKEATKQNLDINLKLSTVQSELDMKQHSYENTEKEKKKIQFNMCLEQFMILFRSGQRVVISVIVAFLQKVVQKMTDLSTTIAELMTRLDSTPAVYGLIGREHFEAGLLEYYFQTDIIQKSYEGQDSLLYTAFEQVFSGHAKVDVQTVFNFAFLTIVTIARLSAHVSKHTRKGDGKSTVCPDMLSSIEIELNYILCHSNEPMEFNVGYLQRLIEGGNIFNIPAADLITKEEMSILDEETRQRCLSINQLYKMPCVFNKDILQKVLLPRYREEFVCACLDPVRQYLGISSLQYLSLVLFGNINFHHLIQECLSNSDETDPPIKQKLCIDLATKKPKRGRAAANPVPDYYLLRMLKQERFLSPEAEMITPALLNDLVPNQESGSVNRALLVEINREHFKLLDTYVSFLQNPVKDGAIESDIIVQPLSDHYIEALHYFVSNPANIVVRAKSGRPASKTFFMPKSEQPFTPITLVPLPSIPACKQEFMSTDFSGLGKRARNDFEASSSSSTHNSSKSHKKHRRSSSKSREPERKRSKSRDPEASSMEMEPAEIRTETDYTSPQHTNLILANILQFCKSIYQMEAENREQLNLQTNLLNQLSRQMLAAANKNTPASSSKRRDYVSLAKTSPVRNLNYPLPSPSMSGYSASHSNNILSQISGQRNNYPSIQQTLLEVKPEPVSHFVPPASASDSIVGSVAVARWDDVSLLEHQAGDLYTALMQDTNTVTVTPANNSLQFSGSSSSSSSCQESSLYNSTAYDISNNEIGSPAQDGSGGPSPSPRHTMALRKNKPRRRQLYSTADDWN